MNNSNIVYINSVIHFKQKALSYSAIRSTFSPEERLEQTLTTISSIRKYIPDAHIILIESGTTSIGLDKIQNAVDTYIYIGNKKRIRSVVDSPYKGAGEIISLLYGLRITRNRKSEYITKISGRYWINEDFDLQDFFSSGKFSFLESKKSYSTRLYALHRNNRKYRVLLLSLGFFISFFNISIESIFYYCFPSRWVSIKKKLGVSGLIGINGEHIHE